MADKKSKIKISRPEGPKLSRKIISETLLCEIAWEVCNQVGGIYTVIRSKAPAITDRWGSNYCLLGPYKHEKVVAEFEPITKLTDPFGRAVEKMRQMGFDVHFGYWLVTGRPKAVLFNVGSIMHQLGQIKYELWEKHHIATADGDHLLDEVIAFGEMARIFLKILSEEQQDQHRVLAHFHEWMAASGIPELRRENVPVTTVFTTHATLLGRYLAMNDPAFYDHLPFLDWAKEANHFNIDAQVKIERAAAHGCHVFSTVSDVTARECEYLLGRKVDVILPNGINNERFEALHEFQNLHQEYKEKIHQFVMAHFFQSYTFDLDKTMYFFTSGRYEYLNKGYDVTLEALARLNYRLQKEHLNITVIMFFITKKPFHSINPAVLQSKAVLEELRHTCAAIQKQVGERLFYEATASHDHRLPSLNDYVDDYWKLRYRRTLQGWKSNSLPPVITHNLENDASDEILNFLRSANLLNHKSDHVKVVYHPDFINVTNPLFGMEYGQFVRGCHLGVFPSYYEPWGYTPLECLASGVPAITSDLAGFGDFVKKEIPKPAEKGIYIIPRLQKSFDESAEALANEMYRFVKLNRRDRIDLRNRAEASAVLFDWQNLGRYYEKAYQIGLELEPA